MTRVDWAPPMAGTEADLATVLADPRRAAANALAVARMLAVRAQLVDVLPGREALGLRPGEFLHAGPPISWDRASGPLRGALMGAAVFEGLADDPGGSAAALAERGAVRARAVPPPRRGRPDGRGGLAVDVGVRAGGPGDRRRAYCSLNEGLGKVLRYGAYSAEVLERLRWMSACSARCCRPRCAGTARSTSPRSSPRWCRWATRRTTGTGPAP